MTPSPTRSFLLALAALWPAAALAYPVTYVASSGSDASASCSRYAPCRSFQKALTVTDPGGTILALDSARFSSTYLDVRQAVTITVLPGERAELSSTNGAIYVNAGPSDVVVLRGLTFVGQDTPPNNAIIFNGGAALHVEGCVVSGWPTKGILALGSAGRQLLVDDSVFRDNYIGVSIDAAVLASVERTRFEHNTIGLAATVSGRASLRDCVASGNSDAGFLASGFGANNVAEINLEGCLAANNGTGVRAEGYSGAAGVARVSSCLVSDNGTGLQVGTSGAVETRGNNTVAGNATNISGTPTPISGH